MPTTRRHFLQGSALSAAALPAFAQSGRSPNDKVQFATIGVGGMGQGDTQSAVATPGTRLVAVCDLYDGRLEHSKELWGRDLKTTRDYREILGRKDIDAVIIGTPDFWHARIAIEAMEAGKDVYVEKPMVQKWADGKQVVEAARRDRAHSAGGQPAGVERRLQEGSGALPLRRHRRAEHGGGLVGPKLGHRRLGILHSA